MLELVRHKLLSKCVYDVTRLYILTIDVPDGAGGRCVQSDEARHRRNQSGDDVEG